MAVRLDGGNLIDISLALASQHSSECNNRRGVEACQRNFGRFPELYHKNLDGCRGAAALFSLKQIRERDMHQIIYLVGLIVVILAILSFFGLR